MKKLLSVIAVAIVAFVFSACGSKNATPEAAVEGYFKCMQKMDFDGLKDVVYFETEAEQEKMIQMYKEKAADDEFRKYMKIESYEIGEVQMAEDGQSAKVKYEVVQNGRKNDGRQKVVLKDGKWYVKL